MHCFQISFFIQYYFSRINVVFVLYEDKTKKGIRSRRSALKEEVFSLGVASLVLHLSRCSQHQSNDSAVGEMVTWRSEAGRSRPVQWQALLHLGCCRRIQLTVSVREGVMENTSLRCLKANVFKFLSGNLYLNQNYYFQCEPRAEVVSKLKNVHGQNLRTKLKTLSSVVPNYF